MTEIAFHFNMPDKLSYGCRLLRKIYLSGARVTVTAEPAVLAELDSLLWRFSPPDFIAHCMADAPPALLAITPVVLTATPAALQAAQAPHGILVNLGRSVPSGFEGFGRLIEVVSVSAEDAQAGRGRWKHYLSQGYPLGRHDLAQREGGAA